MKSLLLVSGLGILAMLAEILKFKKLVYPLVLIGIIAAYLLNFTEWNNPFSYALFDNMIKFDNIALAFSGVLLSVAFFWFILANPYFQSGQNSVDHFALSLFSLCGALMLVSFTHMVTLFLGVEILSIPLYVLAASRKNDVRSNEAGFKYLIMGSFASGFLLFGIALIYGATGTFDLFLIASKVKAIGAGLPGFFFVGMIMMLIAMAFKVSVAPFHFWAPDVYQGSPTVITAFMSTVVKTAAFAAFFRLFLFAFGSSLSTWGFVMAIMIALSLIIANVTAAAQSNVKRMLAFSSISHASFMLMAILAVNQEMSIQAILYYAMAYSFGTIAAFTILFNLSKGNGEGIDLFHGLGKRSPWLAVAMVIALLSLAGIPVTSGFFAKFYIFSTLIHSPYKWLLILAVLTSAVGVYYYFKIIIAMYFKKSEDTEAVQLAPQHGLVILITSIITLAIGLMPDFIIGML